MGIDFFLVLGKKIGNKFVGVYPRKNPEYENLYPKDSIVDSEIPYVNFGRHMWYFQLFGEFKEKVESLAGKKLYFKFYDNPQDFIKPDKILYTCDKLKEIFTKYEKEFPFYYAWISENWDKMSRHDDQLLFKDGCIMTIFFNQEDNKCYLHNNDTQEDKELKEGDIIKGFSFNYKNSLRPDEIKEKEKLVISKKGEELFLYREDVYKIIKENIYERNKEKLDSIIKFCEYAKNKGYFIEGHVQ